LFKEGPKKSHKDKTKNFLKKLSISNKIKSNNKIQEGRKKNEQTSNQGSKMGGLKFTKLKPKKQNETRDFFSLYHHLI
jgi:hypothetical protein